MKVSLMNKEYIAEFIALYGKKYFPKKNKQICRKKKICREKIFSGEFKFACKKCLTLLEKPNFYCENCMSNAINWRIKYQSRIFTRKMIDLGIIKFLPCQICGDESEIHHRNYSDPFDIAFLCSFHHRREHSRLHKLGIKL
jgi:hypothetical protein